MINKIDLAQIFNGPSIIFLLVILFLIKIIYNGFEKSQKTAFKGIKDDITALKEGSQVVYEAKKTALEIELKLMFHDALEVYRKEQRRHFLELEEELKNEIKNRKAK